MPYDSTLEGSQIVFQCNPGFVPLQQMMSVCADGIWTPNPAELVCRGIWLYCDCLVVLVTCTCAHLSYPADCGMPVIANGFVNYTTTVEGSTATYQCDTGLIPVGVMTAMCMENREWAPDPAEAGCRLPAQGMCHRCVQ